MFKITRRQNDNYSDFAGDDEYYGGGFDSVENEETAEDSFSAPAPAPAPAEAPAFGSAVAAFKIVNPKGYEEAPEIANYLMNGNTVILNIEGMAREQAIRLLDYLAGAAHAVGGLMTKVGRTTIVVAPKNVDVSSIEAMVGGN
ncbi:MAG: cell division protein SepF [Clostridia bacterium]|nr:cell division protein SepF [Clostridia bacterium]